MILKLVSNKSQGKEFSALLRYRLQSFGTLSKSTGLLHIASYGTKLSADICRKQIKSIQTNVFHFPNF